MLTDRPFGSLVREDKPAKDLWGILDRHPKPLSFGAIRIKLASPQKIRDWSKYPRAEESVTLGLKRAVVDRLRLCHLAMRPLPDFVRRSQRDSNCLKVRS